MFDLRKPLLAALWLAMAMLTTAWAQTYKDSGGTIVSGVVPLDCPIGGGACTGPSSPGTPISGATLPAGGSGVIGWLSAIWEAVTSAVPAGANIIGNVGVDQSVPGISNGVQLPDNAQFNSSTNTLTCSSCTVNQILVGPLDMTAYKAVDWTAVMPAAASVGWQVSSDAVCSMASNWNSYVTSWTAIPTSYTTPVNTVVTSGGYITPKFGHCMRLIVATYSSGTITISGEQTFSWNGGPQGINFVSLLPTPGNGTVVNLTGSTATTAAVTLTFAAQSGFVNYVCHISVTAVGTTTVTDEPITLSGLLGGVTFTWDFVSPGTGISTFDKTFPGCTLKGALSTAIVLTVPAMPTGITSVHANAEVVWR